jgi:hypothetical protein
MLLIFARKISEMLLELTLFYKGHKMRLQPHAYEEIRNVVINCLISDHPPSQFVELVSETGRYFSEKEPPSTNRNFDLSGSGLLDSSDEELIRDVFWDLFRQGVITLGCDNNNTKFPFFRLSHIGKRILKSQNPWRFHDASSYIAMVRSEVPDISENSVEYLEETSSAFYAGCLLSASVMLGVAAEIEFLRLLKICSSSPSHKERFHGIDNQKTILQKIIKFRHALGQIVGSLPQNAREGLEANFDAIQSVIRIARNDAGHPTSKIPDREQVYVYMQLFIPFARQVRLLREALKD